MKILNTYEEKIIIGKPFRRNQNYQIVSNNDIPTLYYYYIMLNNAFTWFVDDKLNILSTITNGAAAAVSITVNKNLGK